MIDRLLITRRSDAHVTCRSGVETKERELRIVTSGDGDRAAGGVPGRGLSGLRGSEKLTGGQNVRLRR